MPALLTFVFTLSSTLINSQKIILEGPQILSPCKNSMRSSKDKFIITGKMGPDFSALLNEQWKPEVTVQVRAKTRSDFTDFCSIPIGLGGSHCIPHSLESCYCQNVDAFTGFANFVVNATAQIINSEAEFRAKWPHLFGYVVYSDNTVTIPPIFSAANVNLQLKVNGNAVVRTGSACRGKLISESSNTIELCCYNSASPCFVEIVSTDFVVGNTSSCVTYTFTHCNSGIMLLKTFFSVCTMTNFNRFSTCVIDLACSSEITTPENEQEKNKKSAFTLFMGVFWCLIVLLSLFGCQAVISKHNKGVWCHYLNCNEIPVIAKKSETESSAVSTVRRATTVTSETTANSY